MTCVELFGNRFRRIPADALGRINVHLAHEAHAAFSSVRLWFSRRCLFMVTFGVYCMMRWRFFGAASGMEVSAWLVFHIPSWPTCWMTA
jgi:hypothetical protein